MSVVATETRILRKSRACAERDGDTATAWGERDVLAFLTHPENRGGGGGGGGGGTSGKPQFYIHVYRHCVIAYAHAQCR